MFIGDMTLYYNKEDYTSDGSMTPIINIMKAESRTRLYIGGLIGPIASVLYVIGFYHLVLIMDAQHQLFGWIGFAINCVGIIYGGAYHSHYAYLGLLGRYDSEESMSELHKYMYVQKLITFGFFTVGFLAIALFIGFSWTVFPQWMVLFSPGVIFALLPIVRKLPKGIHIIIYGGWTNLISVIYYSVALIVTFTK